jgi:hypothetical protein
VGLDCAIIYIQLIIEHNGEVSHANSKFSYVRSAVGPKDKFVINIFLILIAERDSSAVEGHNSSYRNTINPPSSVVMDKMCTLLTFVMCLLQHGLPYSYLMSVLSFVSISIHHHHNEQQDGKVMPLLVRPQTCLFLYSFLSSIYVSTAIWNVLLR